MNKDLRKLIRDQKREKGKIVNGWLLCEILNDRKLELTRTERKYLSQVLNKIDKDYKDNEYKKKKEELEKTRNKTIFRRIIKY